MGSQDKKGAGTLRADFWECKFWEELVEETFLVRQEALLSWKLLGCIAAGIQAKKKEGCSDRQVSDPV